ncbi:glycosyltransferase [Cryptosporangium phraense]|uniref:Glycosyltransferase family 1 protein n=1 Tax=Cryptosporangium phraense TaxID=2593070 RepID=A0A545ATM8_9ACTN|nr:nucleotide disphospho-sugar-binding domain-containing protein [Cryptosporangium phraense]TQS44684.1 glycosyltransferase family 1 protein [Cryptosporangium phraense]
MSTALFVTLSAGGNLPPMLGVAQRFAAGGGRALVLGHPGQADAVAAAGVEFAPLPGLRPYDPARHRNALGTIRALTAVLTDPAAGRGAVAVAERERADVVVVDCLLLAVGRAVGDAGFRTVTLVHTLPSYFAGPFARTPIGAVAALRGCGPARVWGAASATIATVLPEFDAGRASAFPALHAVGPVTPAPSPASESDAADAVDAADAGDTGAAGSRGGTRARPRVLLSLSSIWYPGQDRTLQHLLDAVAGLDLDAVVTTGASVDPAALRAPANAEVLRHADHEALLPGVDLVVGHGGHGTTMRALAHGVPVLVLPGHPLMDHPAIGTAVAAAGAGRTVSRRSSPAALRALIAELAGPGPHRAAAATVGARIRALDPAGAAVAVLRPQAETSLQRRQ